MTHDGHAKARLRSLGKTLLFVLVHAAYWVLFYALIPLLFSIGLISPFMRDGSERESLSLELLPGIMFGIFNVVVCAVILFAPLRIYLTGTGMDGVIEACHTHQIGMGSPFYAHSVVTNVRPEALPISYCDGKEIVGSPITVIYSDRAGEGVAVTRDPNLMNIIKAKNSGTILIFMAIAISASVVTLARVASLFGFAVDTVAREFARVRILDGSFASVAAKVTEVLSNLGLLSVVFTAVGVMVYAMLRGILYLESDNQALFGLLGAGASILVWSPAPTAVIRWIWQAHRSRTLVIIRNLVVFFLTAGAIRRMLEIANSPRVSEYNGLADILKAVIGSFVGM